LRYTKLMTKLSELINKLRLKIREANLPPELEETCNSLIEESERLSGTSLEALNHFSQIAKYIEFSTALPWNKKTEDMLDLKKAQEILFKNHYGLSTVKDRILEYLAVLKLQTDEVKKDAGVNKLMRAPILCFVGLVGTGKTTMAYSIAEAMGRKFVRIPFGGMSDALELRGQSRVRPDAEPGLMIKAMKFAGSKNPVILLDEIDRVAERARGDIMGVLVELLDPEQNAAFTDHYLDYPFNLSEVLFVATANNTTNIATAVLDRLEPIQMPSYTDEEKIKIGKEYVFPRLLKESGLNSVQIQINDDVWPKIVRPLGFDSGIRSLERNINGICRKIARMIVEGKGTAFQINVDNVNEFLPQW
jgi:ATP-dependent Lon protease